VRVKVTARQRLSTKASGTLIVRADERGSYPLEKLPGSRIVPAGETAVVRLKPRRERHERRIARALEAGAAVTAELKIRLSDRIGNLEVERPTASLKSRGDDR
jgi:hypothetical protein